MWGELVGPFAGGLVTTFFFQDAGTQITTRAITALIVIGGAYVAGMLRPLFKTVLSYVPGLSSATWLADSLIGGLGVALVFALMSMFLGVNYSFSPVPASLYGFAYNAFGGMVAIALGGVIGGVFSGTK